MEYAFHFFTSGYGVIHDCTRPSQVAIAATDLAEIIGSATALYLLFGLPVWAGVLITGVVRHVA